MKEYASRKLKLSPWGEDRVKKLFSEPIHKDPMHAINPTELQKEFLLTEPIYTKAIEEYVVETENEFFFRAVSPWVDRQVKIHVPKKTLLAAVLEFSRNHPEEWQEAIKQCGFKDTDDEQV